MRLIYVSPVPWNSCAQRPHFMVRALLDAPGGIDHVTWLNPYPARLPQWADLRRLRAASNSRQWHPPDPRVDVRDVPAWPFEPLTWGAAWNRRRWSSLWQPLRSTAAEQTVIGVGRPSALALEVLEHVPHAASFYDCMDNFPEFYRGLSRRALARREAELAGRVNRILVSAPALARKFLQQPASRVALVPNASRMTTLPVYRPPAAPRHVLGYVGTIGPWFCWETIAALARALPEYEIELIGPCHVPPPRAIRRCVRLLPACPQSEVHARLEGYAAGLIPFRSNALTDAVDPVKYYEYRAAGLPVLSTPFGTMGLRHAPDGVAHLDRHEPTELLRQRLLAALHQRDEPAAVEAFRRAHDWSLRFTWATVCPSLAATARAA